MSLRAGSAGVPVRCLGPAAAKNLEQSLPAGFQVRPEPDADAVSDPQTKAQ